MISLNNAYFGFVVLFFLQAVSLYFLLLPMFQDKVKALQLSLGYHFFAGLLIFVVVPDLIQRLWNLSSDLWVFTLAVKIIAFLGVGAGIAPSILDYCCIRYFFRIKPTGRTILQVFVINYLVTLLLRYFPCEGLWMFNTETF